MTARSSVMNLLAIETSGDTSSVALCKGPRLIASRLFPSRMSLCQNLAAEIDAILAYLPEDEQVQAIAVSLGPGSFTSLRIGVVTAKALAHHLGVPLAGVPTMEALATPFIYEPGRTICVVQPAWKTALYLSTFVAGEPGQITPPAALEPQAVLDHLTDLKGDLLLVGEAALEHRQLLSRGLGERAAFASAAMSVPRASIVAEVGRKRLSEADPEAAFRLRPLYVVPSQAERLAGIDLGLTGMNDSV